MESKEKITIELDVKLINNIRQAVDESCIDIDTFLNDLLITVTEQVRMPCENKTLMNCLKITNQEYIRNCLEESAKQIDDPNTVWLSHGEVFSKLQKQLKDSAKNIAPLKYWEPDIIFDRSLVKDAREILFFEGFDDINTFFVMVLEKVVREKRVNFKRSSEELIEAKAYEVILEALAEVLPEETDSNLMKLTLEKLMMIIARQWDAMYAERLGNLPDWQVKKISELYDNYADILESLKTNDYIIVVNDAGEGEIIVSGFDKYADYEEFLRHHRK